MQRINICFVTDDNYAPYTGVAMYSILKNLAKNTSVHFYIFDNAISAQAKQHLEQLAPAPHRVSFVDISSCLETLGKLKQTTPHITKTSYLKFFIADLLPQLDKMIYLDGDLIITDDLTPLWNIPIENKLLAAVEDVGYTYWSKHDEKFKLKFTCINSGVMLINCKKWREVNLCGQLLDCALDHDTVGFGQDQPVFNYVCKDQVLFLPFTWNVQDSFFRPMPERAFNPNHLLIEQAARNPAIIHYTECKKPWNSNISAKIAKRNEWYSYARFSPYRKFSNILTYFFNRYIFNKERSADGTLYCFLGIHYLRKYTFR